MIKKWVIAEAGISIGLLQNTAGNTSFGVKKDLIALCDGNDTVKRGLALSFRGAFELF